MSIVRTLTDINFEYQQVVQAGITWKQCAKVPVEYSHGTSTVLNGKVYYGGGVTESNNNEMNVYCYDPPQDNWTTLPPLRFLVLVKSLAN